MQKESERKHQHKEINGVSPIDLNNVSSMPLGEVEQLSQVVRQGVNGRKNSQEQMIDRFVSHDSDSMIGGFSNHHEKNSLIDHHHQDNLIEQNQIKMKIQTNKGGGSGPQA